MMKRFEEGIGNVCPVFHLAKKKKKKKVLSPYFQYVRHYGLCWG